MKAPPKDITSLKIGISSCLLGEFVRFDGTNRRNSLISDVLSRHVEFIPVCPEVEVGMGVPRPPVNLVRTEQMSIRMVTHGGEKRDYTDQMQSFSIFAADRLAPIGGYIFKAKSPSCGIRDVPVYKDGSEHAQELSAGLFAQGICKIMPNLPIADERQLTSCEDLRHFLECASVYQSWKNTTGLTWSGLKEFQKRSYAHVLARGEQFAHGIRDLTRDIGDSDIAEVASRYFTTLMDGLQVQPTTAGFAKAVKYELDRIFKDRPSAAHEVLQATFSEIEEGEVVEWSSALNKLNQHYSADFRSSSFLFPYSCSLLDSSGLN